jgi:hypothetical protein
MGVWECTELGWVFSKSWDGFLRWVVGCVEWGEMGIDW